MGKYLETLRNDPEWRWIAFFLILIFPILGNSISFGWLESRRLLQFIFLMCGVGILSLSIKKQDYLRVSPLFKGTFLVTIAVLTVCLAFLFIATEQINEFELVSLQKGFFSFAYLFIFILIIRFLNKNREHFMWRMMTFGFPSSSYKVPLTVLILGFVMVFKAWWLGPMELQAHIDFGGSTTIVGLSSISAFYAILFALPNPLWLRWFISLPYVYLLFFSTSRTAYVVFFTLWFLLAIRAVFFYFRGSQRSIMSGFILSLMPLLALLAILLPIKFSSRYYPFYISEQVSENIWTYDGKSAQMKKVGYKELIVYRQEELWNRLSRFVRVIYSFYQSPIISDFREGLNNFVGTNLMPDILVGADDYKIEGGHNPEDRWARLAAQSTQGESRTEIIRKTYKLIQDRPQGWWPKSYSNEIDFFCNSNMKCQYTHNILLETSFYFGFILGLAYLFALILLSLNLLKVVIFGTNPLLTGISVVILIHLFGAQFTGTFYDLVVTGFLLLVFGLFVSRSSDSEVGI